MPNTRQFSPSEEAPAVFEFTPQKLAAQRVGFDVANAKRITRDFGAPQQDAVLLREIEHIPTRSDLPPMDIIEAPNPLPIAMVPLHSKANAPHAPITDNGVKYIPVVVSSTLRSEELDLSPEEIAAVTLDAVRKYYDQYHLRPITTEEVVLSGTGIGAVGGAGVSALSKMVDGKEFDRREFGAGVGGALIGTAIADSASEDIVRNSEAFYAQPLADIKPEHLESAQTKIKLWERGHAASKGR